MCVRNWIRWFSLFALVPPALASGCSANPVSEESVQSGTLELPLLSTVNAHTYRLTGYMFLDGPTFSSVDLSGNSPVLSVPLSAGEYTAWLSYWVLERDDGTGSFVPVIANLVSSNSVRFGIYHGTKTTIAFEFETDGVIVRVGSGTLDVRVDVTETPTACAPFGSECGAGAWCPSTELTGRPPACVAAGTSMPGERCNGPLDCVADSSCFDFGSGPLCASLCDVTEFGLPCSTTAECVAAGSDYGVCTPIAAGS